MVQKTNCIYGNFKGNKSVYKCSSFPIYIKIITMIIQKNCSQNTDSNRIPDIFVSVATCT